MSENNIHPVIGLNFADFGAKPDSGEDAGPAMQRALEAAKRAGGAVRLTVAQGRYDFHAGSATTAVYPITNTASEEENPHPVRTVGLFLKGLTDFTLDGNGALFLFHGKMTLLLLDGCERVDIRDLRTDYVWPTVAEMTIAQVGDTYLDLRPHPDTKYEIAEDGVYWVGEGWRFREGPVQVCDLARNTTWRIDNVIAQAIRAEEVSPGTVRLHYRTAMPDIGLAEGWILQARDGIRDQVGVLIHRSRDVRFERVAFHFMHGLGIVGQFSENLAFRTLELAPRPETGRTVAAFADFVHLSGCKGLITVADSRFVGAHDDAINVHGTHLRIVDKHSPQQLRVRFMHPQTFGFAAFGAGDEVAFIRAESLTEYARNTVTAAELLSPREMLLTLRDSLSEEIADDDVLENVTWSPEVEITDNHFARIPTRGVLVTTRKKAVIARNVFERMRMSAVLVADDAVSWYESGPVTDMTIRNNRFIECGSPDAAVILIHPENESVSADDPVHSGIRIVNNVFEMNDARVLDAKSTRSLTFAENTVLVGQEAEDGSSRPDHAIRLTACTDMTIADNRFEYKKNLTSSTGGLS